MQPLTKVNTYKAPDALVSTLQIADALFSLNRILLLYWQKSYIFKMEGDENIVQLQQRFVRSNGNSHSC